MEKYSFTAEKQAMLESLPLPLAVYQFLDRRVVTLALSDGFCRLFGYEDRADAIHDMDYDMYKYDHPDDVSRIAEAALRFATQESGYDVVYRTQNRTGEGYHIVHATGEHVYEDGVRLAYINYIDEGPYIEGDETHDNSLSSSLQKALHEESLLKASRYDSLTGLPNMSYFFELADAGKEALFRQGGSVVLLYLDFNGMKFFNTKYGYAEGDRLLKAFADLLAETFRNENCCRVSGDHFTVYTREEGLEERLHRFFGECAKLNGGKTLPLKVGIYSSREGDVNVSSACDRAKLACDSLRSAYDSGFCYYSASMRDEVEKRQYFLSRLDQAIEKGWIQVYYQPIIRSVSGRVCAEEALARWIDPDRGFLSPADFIPPLEDAGALYKLDLYVVEQVLQKIQRLQQAGLHIVTHSVNLSRSDFDGCDMVEEIRKRVDAAGISRDRLSIEITESVIGRNTAFMKEQVERFRALGFPVWMDDFGSGYSSLDLLQTIQFDLLKFDMSFMRKLDQGESGKIILTELMKMATALGIDTICEGVETQEHALFLREIGCSKQQGYFYCRPIPLKQILERYEQGIQIGFENPAEVAYYEEMGRINLYDFAVIANEDDGAFHHFFNTLPMGIIEVQGNSTRFARSNQSYRDFIRRYFGFNLSFEGTSFIQYNDTFMNNVVRTCCEQGNRSFYDEKMPDGSVVHSFARRIARNPVTDTYAVAVAVLSITAPDGSATYADIARSLAADYYNIYCVNLETEQFIEYSSRVGTQEMAEERHGEDFFALVRKDAGRIYAEDRESFLTAFTKENVVRNLDEQGVFNLTYRLVDTGTPRYAGMKITRMQPGDRRIIIGVSIIDAQMKREQEEERLRQESVTFARIAALSGDFIVIYTVDPATGHYHEYSASREFDRFALAKEGEHFFEQMASLAPRTVDPEDYPMFARIATGKNIMKEIRRNGLFSLNYRLVLGGSSVPVSLRAALVKESDGEKLIVGINTVEGKA